MRRDHHPHRTIGLGSLGSQLRRAFLLRRPSRAARNDRALCKRFHDLPDAYTEEATLPQSRGYDALPLSVSECLEFDENLTNADASKMMDRLARTVTPVGGQIATGSQRSLASLRERVARPTAMIPQVVASGLR